MFFEPFRPTKIREKTRSITYSGHFMWDDSFDNMVVAIHGDVWEFDEQTLNSESYESEQVFFAHMASKDDLNYDGLVGLFYDIYKKYKEGRNGFEERKIRQSRHQGI